jgi:glycine/D-amino acid oxidase-like deaminating enzyme
MPRLAELSVLRVWTGFRPASRDNLPFIGRWQGIGGLWIAAGHEGLGITTSLATGELLADLIVGAEPAIDPAPFDPMRVVGGS